MTAAERNDFDDLGTDEKEEFKIVDLEPPEQDVEKMPDGFELVPITRPSPHEDKAPILCGYALKRKGIRENDTIWDFCGSSMSWVNLLWKVNGLFDTEAYAIRMANWQIEQDKKYAEQRKKTKPIHFAKLVRLPYVNAGADVEKATKVNLQLTLDETVTLENIRQAAKQTHAFVGRDKPVQSNADGIRLILQALKEVMTFYD